MVGNHHVETSPGDLRIDQITNTRLQFSKFARQSDSDVALFTIYGVEFHAKLGSVGAALATSVPCHTSHHPPDSGITHENTIRNTT